MYGHWVGKVRSFVEGIHAMFMEVNAALFQRSIRGESVQRVKLGRSMV